VIQTYSIRETFRDALRACPDVTPKSFPHLYENIKLSKTSGNVSKITRQVFHCLMIVIARLFNAHILVNILKPVDTDFSFNYFPQLKPIFTVLEAYLAELQGTGEKSSIMQKRSSESIVQQLHSDLAWCKKSIQNIASHLGNMETNLIEFEKHSMTKKAKPTKPAKPKFVKVKQETLEKLLSLLDKSE